MIVWLRDLLYDPKSFANFIRATIFLLGEAMGSLGPTAKYYWLAKLVQAGALMIKAGDRNPTPT